MALLLGFQSSSGLIWCSLVYLYLERSHWAYLDCLWLKLGEHSFAVIPGSILRDCLWFSFFRADAAAIKEAEKLKEEEARVGSRACERTIRPITASTSEFTSLSPLDMMLLSLC